MKLTFTTKPPVPAFESGVRYEVGAWVYYRTIQGCRKVTCLGYDKDGHALYAEGWIDVRVTHSTNLTESER